MPGPSESGSGATTAAKGSTSSSVAQGQRAFQRTISFDATTEVKGVNQQVADAFFSDNPATRQKTFAALSATLPIFERLAYGSRTMMRPEFAIAMPEPRTLLFGWVSQHLAGSPPSVDEMQRAVSTKAEAIEASAKAYMEIGYGTDVAAYQAAKGFGSDAERALADALGHLFIETRFSGPPLKTLLASDETQDAITSFVRGLLADPDRARETNFRDRSAIVDAYWTARRGDKSP